jgi:hypothetical protein
VPANPPIRQRAQASPLKLDRIATGTDRHRSRQYPSPSTRRRRNARCTCRTRLHAARDSARRRRPRPALKQQAGPRPPCRSSRILRRGGRLGCSVECVADGCGVAAAAALGGGDAVGVGSVRGRGQAGARCVLASDSVDRVLGDGWGASRAGRRARAWPRAPPWFAGRSAAARGGRSWRAGSRSLLRSASARGRSRARPAPSPVGGRLRPGWRGRAARARAGRGWRRRAPACQRPRAAAAAPRSRGASRPRPSGRSPSTSSSSCQRWRLHAAAITRRCASSPARALRCRSPPTSLYSRDYLLYRSRSTGPHSPPERRPSSSALIVSRFAAAALNRATARADASSGGKEAVVRAGGLRTGVRGGRQSYLRANDSCLVAASVREPRGTQTRSQSRVASCERTRSVS